jgi:hypothetical protein
MAIHLLTPRPRALLAEMKRTIDGGGIDTWTYDQDGDFTHTPAQWNRKAWLRPHFSENDLFFTMVTPIGVKLSMEVYAVYHGRFAEMALAHFDKMFVAVNASALPADGDRLGG